MTPPSAQMPDSIHFAEDPPSLIETAGMSMFDPKSIKTTIDSNLDANQERENAKRGNVDSAVINELLNNV